MYYENGSKRKQGSMYMTFLRKQKLIYFITAITLMFSMLVLSATEANAASAKTGSVNTAVNLREAPSTTSAVIVKMEKDAQVSVLETESGGWYKVKYQDSTGYVRADFIDVQISGLNDAAVIISESAMTQQPGSGEVIKTLPYNTQVTVIGSFGSLYQVKAGSDTGYVPKASVHKHRIIDINLKATLNSSGVNFRREPSTSGDVIEVLRRGSQVTAESIQDKWIRIKYKDQTGFISGNFITYSAPDRLTTMSAGMRGQAVTRVQNALKKKGFFYPEANGVFGNATKAALKKFQESVSLPADGIAGPQTLLVLLGSESAASLWNNYRTEMKPQKPQKVGRVILQDWFDTDTSKGMQSILKKGADNSFLVIDARTGIHWRMMRFGDVTAHWHADVCPMTKSDTEAMKKAWGGELDATRRPVWVKVNGKYYAAGLMGFVHNTDPLPDNGMDGQVCLHFRGSKIHASAHIDEAQQACIMEALAKAAKLDAYINDGKV